MCLICQHHTLGYSEAAVDSYFLPSQSNQPNAVAFVIMLCFKHTCLLTRGVELRRTQCTDQAQGEMQARTRTASVHRLPGTYLQCRCGIARPQDEGGSSLALVVSASVRDMYSLVNQRLVIVQEAVCMAFVWCSSIQTRTHKVQVRVAGMSQHGRTTILAQNWLN